MPLLTLMIHSRRHLATPIFLAQSPRHLPDRPSANRRGGLSIDTADTPHRDRGRRPTTTPDHGGEPTVRGGSGLAWKSGGSS